MNRKRKERKTELLLIGVTALFLCFLLVLHGQDQRAAEVRVDTPVGQETFLPDVSLLDLNTATAEELVELPGVGAALAERIVTYRENAGSFDSVEELLEVSGIGEGTLSALQDLVTVNGGHDE